MIKIIEKILNGIITSIAIFVLPLMLLNSICEGCERKLRYENLKQIRKDRIQHSGEEQ
jgi:hypothetical protein